MHTRGFPFLFTSALLIVSMLAVTAAPIAAYADDGYIPPDYYNPTAYFINADGVRIGYSYDYIDESGIHYGYDASGRLIMIPESQPVNPYDPASIKGMLWKNYGLGGSASERTLGILSNVLQQAEDVNPNDTIYTPDVFERTYSQQVSRFGSWSGNEDPSDQLFKIAAQTATNFDDDFFREWQASPIGIQWNQEGQSLWQQSQIDDDDSLLNAVLIIAAVVAIAYLGPTIFSSFGEVGLEAGLEYGIEFGAEAGFEFGAGLETGIGAETGFTLPNGFPVTDNFAASLAENSFGLGDNLVTHTITDTVTGEVTRGVGYAVGEDLGANMVVQYYIPATTIGSSGAALTAVAIGVDQVSRNPDDTTPPGGTTPPDGTTPPGDTTPPGGTSGGAVDGLCNYPG